KPFQNCRRTRKQELARSYGIHRAALWIGKSEAVAMKHYVRAGEADSPSRGHSRSRCRLQARRKKRRSRHQKESAMTRSRNQNTPFCRAFRKVAKACKRGDTPGEIRTPDRQIRNLAKATAAYGTLLNLSGISTFSVSAVVENRET